MTNRFRKLFLAAALILPFALASNAWCASSKGGSSWGGGAKSGGSRASSWGSGSSSKSSSSSSWGSSPSKSNSSSSSSKSAPSSSSSWGSSTPRTTTTAPSSGWGSSKTTSSPTKQSTWASNSGWGSSKPAARTDGWSSANKPAQLSAADRALADKAKQSGTSYQTRGEAENHFKTQYAKQYSSTFQSEPPSRPTYIPSTTTVNNNHYTVVYDRHYGGYGYYVGSSWYAYDALSDAIVLSSLMNRHSYYYPRTDYGYVNSNGSAVVVQSDTGAWLVGVLIAFIVLFAIATVFVKLSR